MKFSINDFFSKFFFSELRIWLHLLNKSLMENFIFCAVQRYYCDIFTPKLQSKKSIETKVFLPEKWKKLQSYSSTIMLS